MVRLLPVGLLVLAADQVTKWWVSGAIPVGESRPVLPALLRLTHVYNPGAAFGLLPSQQWLFVVVAVSVTLYAWLQRDNLRRQPLLLRFGVVLGLAGALGNTIDRVWRGAVLDFIDVIVIPVFNVADVAITVGVSCVLWSVLFLRPDGDNESPGATYEHKGG